VADSDDTILDVLWQKVVDDPDSQEAHDQLIRHAAACGRLPELAKRYRTRRDELAEDDPLCAVLDERLAAIATLAVAELEESRPVRRERHPLVTAFMVLLGLLFVVSVASLIRALLL
jgi:hypothetical protein